MKLFGIETEKIISFSAIVISIGTLVGITYQNIMFRRQQYASALPYVEMWNKDLPTESSLFIYNNGIGPAFIDKFEVIYGGDSIYEGDLPSFLREIKKFPPRSFRYNNMVNGMLIPAGKVVETVWVVDDSLRASNLKKVLKEIDIRITFSSVYGEQWVATRDGKIPVKID